MCGLLAIVHFLSPFVCTAEQNGTTLVALAAIYNNVDALHRLLRFPTVDASSPNSAGTTPLIWAAGLGHTAVISALMQARTAAALDADARPPGGTALVNAADAGHTDAVVALIAGGADKERRRPRDHATPLLAAAKNGHAATVQALLDAGADVTVVDATGRNAEDIAADAAHFTVAEVLDAHVLQNAELAAARKAEDAKWRLFFRDIDAMFLRHAAAMKQRQRDHAWRTDRFLLAARHGHVELAKEEVDVWRTATGRSSSSPGAFVAAGAPRHDVSAPASVSAAIAAAEVHSFVAVDVCRDKSQQTPLMLAAANGHLPVVEVLLDAGVDVNAADQAGMTALMFACKFNRQAVIDELLHHGSCDTMLQNNAGATAADVAEHNGHPRLRDRLAVAMDTVQSATMQELKHVLDAATPWRLQRLANRASRVRDGIGAGDGGGAAVDVEPVDELLAWRKERRRRRRPGGTVTDDSDPDTDQSSGSDPEARAKAAAAARRQQAALAAAAAAAAAALEPSAASTGDSDGDFMARRLAQRAKLKAARRHRRYKDVVSDVESSSSSSDDSAGGKHAGEAGDSGAGSSTSSSLFGSSLLFNSGDVPSVDAAAEAAHELARQDALLRLGDMLCEAVESGNLCRVRMLLGAGVEPHGVGHSGARPLAVACRHHRTHAQRHLFALLLKAGAAVFAARLAGSFGHTPLYEAADTGALEYVNALLIAGADVDACTEVRRQCGWHAAAGVVVAECGVWVLRVSTSDGAHPPHGGCVSRSHAHHGATNCQRSRRQRRHQVLCHILDADG